VRTEEVRNQRDKIEKQHDQLKVEKQKSDDLLRNILPEEVAEELKEKGNSEPRQYEQVSVLFTDFVNFTGITESMSPKALVSEIDTCFKAFDEIMGRNGLEKIKTIGDAYLAVCGLPHEDPDHAAKVLRAGFEILEFVKQRREAGGVFNIRIGVHSGAVVAGIVGVKKFAYDIWGDTVNTAARMEQNSEPGRINISQSTYELVRSRYHCIRRGKIAAKNKGEIEMYFLEAAIEKQADMPA
jgi:adenylate cyclase